MLDRPFLEAWQAGAQEWREFSAKGQAELLPVADSWAVYEPVGQIPAIATTVKMPDRAAVAAAFSATAGRFVDQEIADRVASLKKQAASRMGDPRPVNSLGVLYAQYGRIDLAAAQFAAASRMNSYVPAIVNLANVRFLSGDYSSALALYQNASRRDPRNSGALLGLARTSAALEKYDDARTQYAALRDLDPDLASQYAYLGEQSASSARAASQDAALRKMSWDEGGQ